jgi:single-stranded-DNA-specific exonuclease
MISVIFFAIKNKLINDINKLGPFGNYNFLPIFLINNLKVIKFDIINNKHVSVILKPESGAQ